MKLVVLALAALCLAACGQSKTVLVEGFGSVQSDADFVGIGASISAEGPTTQAATDKANERVRGVLAGLSKLGLPANSFGARQFEVSADCEYDTVTRKQVCNGYRATSYIAIETAEVHRTGEILETLANLAADEIRPPEFTLSDPTKLQSAARARAIADAHDRASFYARSSGWRLGKVIAVESDAVIGSQFSRFRYTKAIGQGGAVARFAAPQDILEVPITPQAITTSENVFVQYELRGTWNWFDDKTWF